MSYCGPSPIVEEDYWISTAGWNQVIGYRARDSRCRKSSAPDAGGPGRWPSGG